MRISRKAVAVVAAGLLASPVVASSVSAQSSNNMKDVVVKGAFVGPIPAGVAGFNVSVECKNLTNIPTSNTQTLTAGFGTLGGSTTIGFGLTGPNYIPLTATPPTPGTPFPGSSCKVSARTTGSPTSPANLGKGVFSISVGGTARTVSNSASDTPAPGSLSATTVDGVDGFIPVFSATEVVVTLTYPQITVKKVVNGDEPVAGFSYPMSINCANPTFQPIFVSTDVTTTNTATSATYYTKSGYAKAGGQLVTGGAKFNGVATGTSTYSTPANTLTTLIWADGTSNSLAAVTADSTFGLTFDATGQATVTSGGATSFTKAAALSSAGVTYSPNFLSFISGTTQYLVFDGAPVPAPVYSATTGALISTNESNILRAAIINAATTYNQTGTVSPAGFDGTFTLKGGASRVFGNNDFPSLTAGSVCEVTEFNSQGGVILYSSTTAAGTTLPGVQAGTVWKSALTAMQQTITVSNSFYGDLVISKVVTGDSKSNISTFEISVACDKGGPKDTFLLKDRQSKVYNNIAVGTNCLVTETKSDGAVASYSDNVGDNTTDGRVTIKQRGNGCAQVGAPTNAAPGGPSPVTSFNECWANVIITNDYNPPATTEAPAAAAPATAAPATAAPAVTPAPATPVEATATFTG